MNGSDYIAIVTQTIENAWKTQTDEIAKASSEIAAAIIRKTMFSSSAARMPA